MKNISSLWFLLPALLIVVSCSRQEPKQEGSDEHNRESNVIPQKDSIPVFGFMNGDTIHLAGKFVLFYSPDENSFKSKKVAGDSLKFFHQVSQVIMDSLKRYPEIKTSSTTASFFKIYTSTGNHMIITRSALKSETGMLVSDGMQPPTMKHGIHPAKENLDFIKKFFFLK